MNLIQQPEPVEKRPSRFSAHSIIGTVAFVAVLGVVSLFSWRVFSFYRDIQTGEINPGLGYTTTDFSRAATAFAKRAAESGDGDLALLGPNDETLGTDNPKITIVEFVDFGCTYSKEAAPIVRAIARQYAEDVRVVLRNYPLDDLHPGASIAAQGGGCAGEQGKFWEYHDAVMASGGDLSVETLSVIADELDLDIEKFQRCIDSGYYVSQVTNDLSDGAAVGVVGTPTFFFNGQKVEGSIPFTIFTNIVDAMLKT